MFLFVLFVFMHGMYGNLAEKVVVEPRDISFGGKFFCMVLEGQKAGLPTSIQALDVL